MYKIMHMLPILWNKTAFVIINNKVTYQLMFVDAAFNENKYKGEKKKLIKAKQNLLA
jgi:glutathionyl-hydroquinone reductase